MQIEMPFNEPNFPNVKLLENIFWFSNFLIIWIDIKYRESHPIWNEFYTAHKHHNPPEHNIK